jgi:hypothetical protein
MEASDKYLCNRHKFRNVAVHINNEGYDGDCDYKLSLELRVDFDNPNYATELRAYHDFLEAEEEERFAAKRKRNIERVAGDARKEYKKAHREDRVASRIKNILSSDASAEDKLEEVKQLVERAE